MQSCSRVASEFDPALRHSGKREQFCRDTLLGPGAHDGLLVDAGQGAQRNFGPETPVFQLKFHDTDGVFFSLCQ